MRHVFSAICGCALLAAGSTGAQAQSQPPKPHDQPDVQAWVRATPAGVTVTAAYLSLRAPQDDRLLSISSPQASSVSLHHMAMQGDMMVMQPIIDGVMLPSHQLVSLQPGGDHAMVEGLRAPLRMGDVLHLHLVFQHAPPVDIDAPVRGMGDQG